MLGGLGQELAGCVRLQVQHELPGQDAPAEVVDGCVQIGARSVDIRGNHRSMTTTDPAGGRGAWNTEVTEQVRIALLADEVAHPVVVGTAAGGGEHGVWLPQPGPQATIADVESFAISRVLHLHAQKSGMFWLRSWAAAGARYAELWRFVERGDGVAERVGRADQVGGDVIVVGTVDPLGGARVARQEHGVREGHGHDVH